MTLDELQSLMRELAAGVRGVNVEVGRTNRHRHDEVYIKLISSSDSERFARISTSGSGAFELTVDSGFSTGMADDQADIDDAREYLASYVRAGSAYLDGHWSIRKSAVLRVPMLTIESGGSRLNLALPRHWSSNDVTASF